MKIARTKAALSRALEAFGRDGERVALVPTMGCLHAGHLSLVTRAQKHADRVVVSVFVNPMQFGPAEDLSRYPRDVKGDLAKLKSAGVDLVFLPRVQDIYPAGFQSKVLVSDLSRGLCGTARPGHFDGVATVVLKLFNLVRPRIAVFGEKDWQQLQVIRALVRDLEVPVKIVGAPIVREPDGLAMSSRNVYLSRDERALALGLSRGLRRVAKACQATPGLSSAAARKIFLGEFAAAKNVRVDYFSCVECNTLLPLQKHVAGKTLFAAAVFIGKTRLIDNIRA